MLPVAEAHEITDRRRGGTPARLLASLRAAGAANPQNLLIFLELTENGLDERLQPVGSWVHVHRERRCEPLIFSQGDQEIRRFRLLLRRAQK